MAAGPAVHAECARMARLLGEPGRCGAGHGSPTRPARRLGGRKAPLPRAADPADRRADEPHFRGRVCRPRAGNAARGCRRGRYRVGNGLCRIPCLHRPRLRAAGCGAAGYVRRRLRRLAGGSRAAARQHGRLRDCGRTPAHRHPAARLDGTGRSPPLPREFRPGERPQTAVRGDPDMGPRGQSPRCRNAADPYRESGRGHARTGRGHSLAGRSPCAARMPCPISGCCSLHRCSAGCCST